MRRAHRCRHDDGGPRWPGDVLCGVLMAAVAVFLRASMPMPMLLLPYASAIIAVCLATYWCGIAGGLSAMATGGWLTWRFLFSYEPEQTVWIISSGYAFVAFTVLGVTHALRRAALREIETEWLFSREMAHRTKNMLAMVQSLARQTFPRDLAELVPFEGRLRALSDANSLLDEHARAPSASVGDIVDSALDVLSEARRFKRKGPALYVRDQQVISLALALHELCTNAIKYGSLSVADGYVSIEWREECGKVVIDWKERGGPIVKEPENIGFGTRLLSRSAMGTAISYEPDGLYCRIELRLANR